MSKTLIQLKSFTYAARASRLCDIENIKSKVVKTPKKLSKSGCGYSIQVPSDRADEAIAILKANKVVIVDTSVLEES